MSFNTVVIPIINTDNVKQGPDITCKEGVQLLANALNTGDVLFASSAGGYSGIDNSFPLVKGKGVFLPCTNLNQIYFKTAETTSQKIHCLLINQ